MPLLSEVKQMIDLGTLSNKTFDVRLIDGTELNIRKPSNELLKETYKMIELIEKNGEEKNIINAIYIFITKIINRNLNDKKFTQSAIEELIDIDVAMYLIKEYQSFLAEVIQGINF